MNGFTCEIELHAPAANVYEALTTPRGIKQWWTTSADVGTNVGEHITIRFGQTFKVMRIDILSPAKEIRWSVIDAHLAVDGLTRTDEWIGSTIRLTLATDADTRTRLQLEHVGLTPAVECYDLCSQGWLQFLQSLKHYVETGKGAPYVDPSHQSSHRRQDEAEQQAG